MLHGETGSKSRQTAFAVVLLLLLVSVGAAALKWQLSALPTTEQRSAPQGVGGLVKGDEEAEEYTAEPGKKDESAELNRIEDYWYTRVSYPTGKYDGRWLLQAAQQDKRVQEKVPTGRVTYRDTAQSPLSLDPNAWTSLGPQPLQSDGCTGCFTYGHVAGRVNDIEVDPVSPNVAYIATVGGGVWKTTNCCTATTTWAPTTDDPLISTLSVDDLSIDPNDHNTVYAGTGDLNFGSFSMGSVGVLKTTDAGATWSVKGSDVFAPYYPEPPGLFPQYQAIGKVEADPNNPNILVAGTKTGVYISYNRGDNWTGPCLSNPYTNQRQDTTGLILSDAGTTTDMYVAVGARGYSSTVQINLAENGANGIYKVNVPASGCPTGWRLVTRPDNGWPVGTGTGTPVYMPNGDQLGRIDIAIAPSNPNYMYAVVQAIGATNYQGGVLGVWRTTDAGTTWQQRALRGDNAAEWQGCDRTGQQNWYNQHIEVDPNNPDVVLVDTIDIFKSTNGADTFTNITCGYQGGRVHVDQHALEYIPGSSSLLLAGNDGGVYVSSNADQTTPTFAQLNDSLNTIEFYSGDITPNFANAPEPGINAGSQDNGSPVNVWRGVSPGATVTPGPMMWQLRKGGDGMFARIEPILGIRWYQESQDGNLAVTTNGPYSAQSNATGGWTADRRSFIFPYEIFKGTPGDPANDCPATGCTHLIAGSYRVWETVLGAVPRTSWYPNSPDLTKGTLADRSIINQLSYANTISTTAVVGTNDGNFWYGFGLGTGITNTATWVDVTGANVLLPNRPILDVTTDPVNPLVAYAAVGGFDQNTPSTPGHVFRVTCTANCAAFTWENKTGNLPNIPVDTILANPNFPQQVFVGTDWGFYFTDDINSASPAWFRFNQGLPNIMIWDMAIDRGSTTLALFTRGRGAYAWPLPAGAIGPTLTPTGSPTSTATVTETPTITNTPSQTNTRTATLTRTSTATRTNTPTATATATCVTGFTTPVPWATASPRANSAYGLAGASDGTYFYAAGGYDSNNNVYISQIERYNPATDAWTNMGSLPAHGEGISFVYSPINNKIYGFGGAHCTAGTIYDNTRIYDVVTGNWSTGAPMPQGLHQMAVGYLNGKIYLAGGYDSCAVTPVNTLYEYDVLANTWTTRANVPAFLGGASGGVVNGRFYVAGGRDLATPNRNNLYEYNPATNTWATRAALPTGVNGAASAVVGTQLWVFGGGNPFLGDGLRPQPGRAQSPNTTGVTQIYNADTNTWTSGPSLNVGRSFLAGGAVGTRIVAVGGFDGTNSVNTTEIATAGGVCGDPTPSMTATSTAIPSSTATATVTRTAIPTNTTAPTNTAAASNTAVVSATTTRTSTAVASNTVAATNTVAASATTTRAPSNTVVSTATSAPTNTVAPSNTVAATNTAIVPTSTTAPSNTSVATSTSVATQAVTNTPAATQTSVQATATTQATTTAQATATACTLQFADVPPSNTFYPFIHCLACKGIISGYPCGGHGEPCNQNNDPYFRPNNWVTRGQLAKVVSESAGFNEPVTGQTFEDVPPQSPFYEYVERLASRGVMGGYQCGIDPQEPCGPGNLPYFRPNAGATRGQLTKIVSNAAGFNDTIPETQYQFADVQPNSTFWIYVERLLLNRPGVMSGYPCGGPHEPCDSENRPYFRPGNPLTRGQTAKIVVNTFFEDCAVR